MEGSAMYGRPQVKISKFAEDLLKKCGIFVMARDLLAQLSPSSLALPAILIPDAPRESNQDYKSLVTRSFKVDRGGNGSRAPLYRLIRHARSAVRVCDSVIAMWAAYTVVKRSALGTLVDVCQAGKAGVKSELPHIRSR
ncbi:hypothetical protein BS50DRAFT_634267 [Corynespora cassiicola Philippines]|uniref:Uncharacterized protein n=1 Tax=Corynespora cassiicola Philippines TaxID=1448308 RepID=A0A2T2NN46_CORCC|nr:hypothetical protein BS50DRAFT_634267 [Corynespora cassiicola Philippines]